MVLCSWLMAKQSIVDKYCSLYTDLGIDVLQVSISPADLLMPVQRAQVRMPVTNAQVWCQRNFFLNVTFFFSKNLVEFIAGMPLTLTRSD